MSVVFDAAGTESTVNNTTVVNNATLTVGTSTNRALVVTLSLSSQLKSTSVTWDQGGANQVLTFIGGANGTGTVGRAELWGLVNPVSGNKSLRWTGGASDVCIDAVAYTGVRQEGGSTSFPNFASSTATQAGTSTSTNGVLVISASTNALVAAHASDQGTYNSVNNTQLYIDNTPANISAAGNRAAGAASVTMSGSLTTGVGAGHWVIVGMDIATTPPGVIPSSGAYAQESSTSDRYQLEDGSGVYLIEPWPPASGVVFPPWFPGDMNGLGTPGYFFKDRLG